MSEYLQYGGQAVVEGVMMRSPRYFAVACRKPDGEIVLRAEPIEASFLGRLQWLKRPFLRGSLALIDAMALGMKALNFSAQVQAEAIPQKGAVAVQEDSGVPSTEAPAASAPAGSSPKINDIVIGGVMVLAFLLGVVIFVALPTLLTQLVQTHIGVSHPTALNVVDGIIRIAIFLAYVASIARMKNIRRVFQYHGAEHKAINTLEAGGELSVEVCSKASRIHHRCGTSFVIIVLLASILVHSLFPRPPHYFARVVLHTALIPLVAGVAYEVIRLAGRMRNARVLTALLAPGRWTQGLTTREPDVDQVEVALTALKAVVDRERAPAQAPEGPSAAVA
ncbi:MAG TPA: DUF1385 domain-containing protein [Chthonomonadales bacterium]|nr:DUF1385 domain-containing protein [Chthonomonadales bacterium]